MANDEMRKYIEQVYNSAPGPQTQTQTQFNPFEVQKPTQTPAFNSGMTRDEIASIYNADTQIQTPSDMSQVQMPNIDDLKKQLADTTTNRTEGETQALKNYIDGLTQLKDYQYKQNYNSQIKDLQNQLADPNAQRTEGETQAIQTYLDGLTNLQKEIDRHNAPKVVKKNPTKTIQNVNTAKEYGKKVLEAVKKDTTNGTLKAKGYSLSPNEQRDLERAINATQNAYKKEERKWNALSTNEQRDVQKATEAVQGAYKKAQEKIQKAKEQNFENVVKDIGNRIEAEKRTGKTAESFGIPTNQLPNYDTEFAKHLEEVQNEKYRNNMLEDGSKAIYTTKPVYQDNTVVGGKNNGENGHTKSDEEFVNAMLSDPSYKMSDEEVARAKQIIDDYELSHPENMNGYTFVFDDEHPDGFYAPSYAVDANGNYDPSKVYTDEELNYRSQIDYLKDKAYGYNTPFVGAMSMMPGVGTMQRNFIKNDPEYAKWVEMQKAQNPGGYYTGMAVGLAGTIAANMAGSAAMAGTKYGQALTNLIGKDTLGKRIATSALMDVPVDLAIDTVPELIGDIASGQSAGQTAKDVAVNMLTNAGFNILGSLVSNSGDIASAIVKYINDNGGLGAVKNLEVAMKGAKNADEAKAIFNEVVKPNYTEDVAESVAKTFDDVLNPTSNKQADRILNDANLKAQFEAENGIRLTGTKAEQRRAILDITEAKRQNEVINGIMENTDDVKSIPTIDNGADDALEQMADAQRSLNPLDEEIPTYPKYNEHASGQMTFIDGRGKQLTSDVPTITNTPDASIKVRSNTNRTAEEILADLEGGNVAKNVTKASEDISEGAKAIYRGRYVQKWENLVNNSKKYGEELRDYVKAFDIDDTGVQGAEATRLVDNYMEAVERLKTAKTKDAAYNAYGDMINTVMELDEFLSDKYITDEIVDEFAINAYNDVMSYLKGKTLYLNPSVKAEFPDGTFAMNKFGNNVRFTTDPKKGVSLDSMPEVKEALGRYVNIDGANDIDTQKKLFDFLTETKNPKKLLNKTPYDRKVGMSLADNTENLYKQKLDQLGYTSRGKKTKVSEFYTNTGAKQGTTDVEYAKHFNEDDFRHITHTDDESMKEAFNILNNNSEEAVIKNLDTKKNWDYKDVDTAMIMQSQYIKDAQALEQAGDIEKADEMWEQASKMLQRVQKQASNSASNLQALVKWNKNTPEGQLAHSLSKIRQEVDAKYGKGYSMAIDYVGEQISSILKNAKNPKEALNQVDNLLKYNLQFFAEKAGIKGVNGVPIKAKELRKQIMNCILPNGNYKNLTKTDIDEIMKVFLKENRVASITAKDEKDIFKLLNQAAGLPSNTRKYKELRAEAMKIMSDAIPSKFGDKVRTVLYDNMLSSLKTTITRNAGSNALYNALEDSTKWEKALVDRGVSLFTKKRSHLSTLDSLKEGVEGFKQGAKDSALDFLHDTHTTRSGEEAIEDAFQNVNNAFKNKDWKKPKNWVNNVFYNYDKVVGGLMEMGDRPFYEKTYRATKAELEQLISKYGSDGLRSGIKNSAELSDDELVMLISRNEALRSVMQNKSEFTEGLQKISQALNKITKGFLGTDSSILSQSSMPFTQIPGNMLDRFIEYIPGLGMARNVARSYGEVASKQGLNQRRFVDELTHQINGGLMFGGALGLANSGMISDAYSDDPDKKKMQQNNDYQEFAFQPLGENGPQYDLSDIPVLGPMLVAGKRWSDSDSAVQGMWGALEGSVQDSLYQGISRLTGQNTYDSSQGIFGNIGNAIASSSNQLIPSFARQIAQYNDPYKRDLGDYGTAEYYTNLFNNSLPGNWEMSDVPVLNQIPIVQDIKGRESMNPRVDMSGNPVLQNGGEKSAKKFFDTFIAPYKETNPTFSESYNEAERLEEALKGQDGNKGAYTPVIKKTDLTDIKGYDADNYSHQDLYNMQVAYYSSVEKAKNEMYQTDYYKSLSDAEKLEVNNKLNSVYKSVIKSSISSEYEPSSDKELVNLIKNGGSMEEVADLLSYKSALKENNLTDSEALRTAWEKGESAFNKEVNAKLKAKEEKAEKEQAIAEVQPSLETYGLTSTSSAETYNKAKTVIPGLTTEKFVATYKAIDSDHSQGIKQDEIIDYLNRGSYSKSQAEQIWKAYGSANWKKVPVLDKNGKWKKS